MQKPTIRLLRAPLISDEDSPSFDLIDYSIDRGAFLSICGERTSPPQGVYSALRMRFNLMHDSNTGFFAL